MKKTIAIVIVIGIIFSIFFAGLTYKKVYEKMKEKGIKGRYAAFHYASYTILVIINAFLLISLLIIYLDSYLKTRSSFMLGLVFFIGVLLIQTILLLPIVRAIFGYQPFYSLPYLFEMLALIILLILSLE